MAFCDREVSLVLAGAHDSQATLSRQTRVAWVADLFRKASLDPFDDPRWLAVKLGLRLRPVLPRDRVPAKPCARTIYYAWSTDTRALGAHVHQGLAAKLLAGRDHAAVDVYLLAGEIALPTGAIQSRALADLMRAQRFAPQWWIASKVSGLRPSGVLARPKILAV